MTIPTTTIIIGTGTIITFPITIVGDGSARISTAILITAMGFSILRGGMIPGIIMAVGIAFVRISL